MQPLEQVFDLREVSQETFNDLVRNCPDAVGQQGEDINSDTDLIVTHYFDRYTNVYLGTIRLTDDGMICLVPDEEVDADKMSERELYELLYGA